MNILGKCKIYSKDFNGRIAYSTNISRKEQDGTYKNMYVQVQLPKDVVLENNTEINITKGFITFYEDKNGLSHIKFIVMDFEGKENIDELEINTTYGDDLPF